MPSYMTLRSLLVPVLILGSQALSATHIVGGEMYYDHLGGSQYQVTVKLYRDCTGIAYDNPIRIGVYNGVTNAFLFSQNIAFPGATNVDVVLDNPCLAAPPSVCVQVALYTAVFDLPPTPEGYILSYQRCCRTPVIINVPNPGSLGLTVMTRVPGQDIVSNSSARFNMLPPIALCVNEPLVFDHSAIDADGDQLTYELCTPFDGGTGGTPNPIPGTNTQPPYTFIPWGTDYSETYPIDSSPIITIDPVTGQLTLTPTQQGSYVVGVCVNEYRNGVLLGITRRDFLFEVVPCDASVVAGVLSQAASAQVCVGTAINYTNTSVGASTYFWDFGDPATQADTSSVENPSWTYAEPGTYNVTLIANPGLTCSDTTVVVYAVYDIPVPLFDVPDALCGPSEIQFNAAGEYYPTADLQWDFGGSSQPPTASGQQVSSTFAPLGVQPVTLTATQNGCTGSFTANVAVHPFPVAAIQPQQQFCTGLTMNFGNASQGASSYAWIFGDPGDPGAGSTESAPSHTYSGTGTHPVTLIATSQFGCVDTVQSDFAVYETPLPTFTLPDTTCGNVEVTLEVEGQHFGAGADVQWDFGPLADPSTANGAEATTTFTPGEQNVTVTVTENGCTGSFAGSFIVFPLPDAFFVADLISPQPDGTVVTFTDQSASNGGNIVAWSWDIDDFFLGSDPVLVWTGVPVSHAVTLEITTDNGCVSTYTLGFTIIPEEIEIPNVFTPNNDGQNDYFVIVNGQYYENTLNIFNRWGTSVYSTTNYRNNWRGPELPDGTYFYVFTLSDGREFTGHLTLLR